MAVHRMLAGIDRRLDRGLPRERVHRRLDLGPRRVEDRHRRARPDEHPDRNALGDLGEQVAHAQTLSAADELEAGRDVPAGDVDEPLRARDRVGDGRERLAAVDEDVDGVALTWRWVAFGPEPVAVRRNGALPPEPIEPVAVPGLHGSVDAIAHRRIHTVDQPHGPHVPGSAGSIAGTGRGAAWLARLLWEQEVGG